MHLDNATCKYAYQPNRDVGPQAWTPTSQREGISSPVGWRNTVPAGPTQCLLLLNRRSRAEFGAELMRQGHLTEPSMKCPFAANTAWVACPFRA
jgi:hypothetical protein